MKTSKQILPGIKRVAWLDCELLSPEIVKQAEVGLPVCVITELHTVALNGETKCSRDTEQRNGGTVESASLSFASDVLLPMQLHLGFVVTDVEGQSYLIGAKEAPWPKVKVTADAGSTDGDAAGFYYEVNHEHVKTLIQCDAITQDWPLDY